MTVDELADKLSRVPANQRGCVVQLSCWHGTASVESVWIGDTADGDTRLLLMGPAAEPYKPGRRKR